LIYRVRAACPPKLRASKASRGAKVGARRG